MLMNEGRKYKAAAVSSAFDQGLLLPLVADIKPEHVWRSGEVLAGLRANFDEKGARENAFIYKGIVMLTCFALPSKHLTGTLESQVQIPYAIMICPLSSNVIITG